MDRGVRERGRMLKTYGGAADVGMPDLGQELHLRALEGVRVGHDDFDLVAPALVRRVGRAGDGADEPREGVVAGRGGVDARVVAVGLYVLQLLGYAAISGGYGHCCLFSSFPSFFFFCILPLLCPYFCLSSFPLLKDRGGGGGGGEGNNDVLFFIAGLVSRRRRQTDRRSGLGVKVSTFGRMR